MTPKAYLMMKVQIQSWILLKKKGNNANIGLSQRFSEPITSSKTKPLKKALNRPSQELIQGKTVPQMSTTCDKGHAKK